MPPIRSQRSAETLEALRADVRAEFGPGARIVAAERVTTGGIGGLFRKHHYEATVEVPAPGDEPTARVAIDADGPRRVGILALLEDAEAREDRLAAVDRVATRRGRRAVEDAPAPVRSVVALPTAEDDVVATRSDVFASLMDDFTFNGLAPRVPLGEALAGDGQRAGRSAAASLVDSATTVGATAVPSAAPPAATVPEPLQLAPVPPAVRTADGDLVLVVGRPALLAEAVPVVAAAHVLRVVDVTDRRSAILARAAGVQEGSAVVAAFPRTGGDEPGERLSAIAPDQVWVVVDAGRKHDDTAREVRAVQAVLPVAGVISMGVEETSSPETVHMLGLPVVDVRAWR